MDKLHSSTSLRIIKNKYTIKPKNPSELKKNCTRYSTCFTEIKKDKQSFITDINDNTNKNKQSSFYNFENQLRTEINKTIRPVEREKKCIKLLKPPALRKSSKRLSFYQNEKTKEELDVMRLNHWKGDSNIECDNKYLRKKYAEVDIRDKKKSLQDILTKSKSMNISLTLEKFYKKMEQENAAIFIQNINLAKENFKFEHFIENDILFTESNTDDIDKKELIQVGRRVTFIDKKNTADDDILKKYYHLKMQGEYSKLTSREYYKEIIHEKEKIEKIYNRE
jgi:hypothetical protein